MILALETQLGEYANNVKKSISEQCNLGEEHLECSIFLYDLKRDAFVLRASTTGTNYLGKAQLDTSEQNQKNFTDGKPNVGLTASSIFLKKHIICEALSTDKRFSCYRLSDSEKRKWQTSNYCELPISDISSVIVFPFRFSGDEESDFDGVIRVVLCSKIDKNIHKPLIDNLSKMFSEYGPKIKSSIFLSQLIEIGSITDLPHLCKQAAKALKDLLNGKGCTIFLLDEMSSRNGSLIYKPYGTTGLTKRKIVGGKKEYEFNSISDPLKDTIAWYFYDKNYENMDQPEIPLTLGVIRARMPAFIDDLNSSEEIESVFPDGYRIRRKQGPGKVCEYYLDSENSAYKETESILYAPMFFGDPNNVYSEVMGVVRIGRDQNGGRFDVSARHLFVSIVERLSDAVNSAKFLQALDNLSDIAGYREFFEETVKIMAKFISGTDCALLIGENQCLYRYAEWKNGQTSYVKNDEIPYLLSGDKGDWGYSGYVFKNCKTIWFNNPKEKEKKYFSNPVKHRTISGDEPHRFLGIPIRINEMQNEALGVLRICKDDRTRNFTSNDIRMLEIIERRIRPKILEFKQKLKILKDRERIFSKVLQNNIRALKSIQSRDILIAFFENPSPSYHVEFEILDLFKDLWKYYNSEYDFNTKLFKDFELFNQNILSEIPYYRDHFIHQFSVYLIGIIIIDKLLDKFLSTFMNTYKTTSVSKLKLEDDSEKAQIQAFVEFCWLKTALFHDIAYPVQSLQAWVMNILKKYLKGYRLDLKSRLPLGEIFFDPGYIDNIDHLVNYHKNELNRKDKGLREKIIDLLYNQDNRPDHGIISALLLVGENQFIKQDILPCASAIALHNNLIKQSNVQSVKFEEHPLAFLLIFCDLLHEWGRDQFTIIKKYPNLIDLMISNRASLLGGNIDRDPLVNDALIDRFQKDCIIYSKIRIYDESEHKERELHKCFEYLESDSIDFFIAINNKIYPE